MTFPLALGVVLFWSASVFGKMVNRTIDDTFPDPVTGAQVTYSSSDSSIVWGNYASCDGCTAKPDRGQAYNGTWHDSTFDPTHSPLPNVTASVSFTGTAIYVYCIVPSSSQFPNGFADITFYIDGTSSGIFTRTPPGNAGYDYSTLVFAQTGLKGGQHTLMIQNGRAETKSRSLILLDYITYTTDDGNQTISQNDSGTQGEKKGLNTGAIAGIAAGLVVLALFTAASAFLLWRKKRTGSRGQEPKLVFDSENPSEVSPFTGTIPASVSTRSKATSPYSRNPSVTSPDSSALTNPWSASTAGSSVSYNSHPVSTNDSGIVEVPREDPPIYTESEHGSSGHVPLRTGKRR